MLLLFLACAEPAIVIPDSSTDTAAEAPCAAWITDTWPLDGASEVYYRESLTVHFSSPVEDVFIDAPVEGAETWSADGLTLTFTPAVPLEPLTDYTFGVEFCGGSPEVTFSTSELGGALSDPAWLEGITYAVDLSGGRFEAGGLLGQGLAAAFGRRVLLRVTEVEGEHLSVRAAVSEAHSRLQDRCYRTMDLAGISLSGPDFAFATSALEMDLFDAVMSLFEVRIEGSLAPDLTWAGGGSAAMLIDVDSVLALLMLEDAEALCEVAADLEAPCGPCPTQPLHDCVALSVLDLEGVGVDSPLDEVVDPTDYPECQ